MGFHETAASARPVHAPVELVRHFDLYETPEAGADVQAAYSAVQRSFPDIFWTPHSGGKRVATRGEDIIAMQRD